MGVKLFDLGIKLFGLRAGRLEFFCRTDEEKVDCRRERPMPPIVCVRAQTLPNFTRVVETLDICM